MDLSTTKINLDQNFDNQFNQTLGNIQDTRTNDVNCAQSQDLLGDVQETYDLKVVCDNSDIIQSADVTEDCRPGFVDMQLLPNNNHNNITSSFIDTNLSKNNSIIENVPGNMYNALISNTKCDSTNYQFHDLELTSTMDDILRCLLPDDIADSADQQLECMDMTDFDVIQNHSTNCEIEAGQESLAHQATTVNNTTADEILHQYQTGLALVPLSQCNHVYNWTVDNSIEALNSQEQSSSNEDLVLPVNVNIMRLLQDQEDDVADDIMEYVESHEAPKRKRETKVSKNSHKKRHPSQVNVKCQVCSRKAAGFHYGADVCTGCKLFFYRNHKSFPKHSCKTRSGKNAIACTGCRMEECVKAGMNIKISRKGRYSYKRMHEYAMKIAKEEISLIPTISHPPQPITDEIITIATRISEVFLSCNMYPPNYFENLSHLHEKYDQLRTGTEDHAGQESSFNVIRPQKPPVLFPEMHLRRYTHARTCLQSYYRFVKQLPAFRKVPEKEQWEMFIYGFLYLLLISEYRAYDVENGLEFHVSGTVATRQELREHIGCEYDRLLFNIVGRLQKLNLDENERNLLKLVGFFTNHHRLSEHTNNLSSREQDVMIRAFDYVVRANRPNGNQAAVVIGNAMQAFSDIVDFGTESAKDFYKNLDRYPANLSNWLKRNFITRNR